MNHPDQQGSEEKKPPIWYTENEMHQWLIRENYSEQIAGELSKKWAEDLQGAFNKGFEKGTRELESLRSELSKKQEKIDKLELELTKLKSI